MSGFLYLKIASHDLWSVPNSLFSINQLHRLLVFMSPTDKLREIGRRMQQPR